MTSIGTGLVVDGEHSDVGQTNEEHAHARKGRSPQGLRGLDWVDSSGPVPRPVGSGYPLTVAWALARLRGERPGVDERRTVRTGGLDRPAPTR